jgi:collagen triple helix repeat protein
VIACPKQARVSTI